MVPVHTQTRKEIEDNRILVRVSPGHPCLSMSPYATMIEINKFLNEKLVREIQITKTGFAICPISALVQEVLYSRMSDSESFLSTKGICKVEKPTNHSAYLLSGIPRTYAGFNGNRVETFEITARTISEALRDLTNVAPIDVIESRRSSSSQYLAQKERVVLYPAGSSPSRYIPLFGVRVHIKLFPRRIKIPQCGNCFGWHNERTCSRITRGRLCGSTQYIESEHTSCTPGVAHNCPHRFVNCHGPHPADSLECLVRPGKNHRMPSKAEISKIRQAASAARLRLKIMHCDMISKKQKTPAPVDSVMDMNVPASTPPTMRRLFTESPAPTKNRFAALGILTKDKCDTSSTNAFE